MFGWTTGIAWRLVVAGALLIGLAPAPAAAREATVREPLVRKSAPAAHLDLSALRAGGADAGTAVNRLRALGDVSPAAAARALRAVDYPPRDIERALTAVYRVPARASAGMVRDALRDRLVVERNAALDRAAPVSICVRPDGSLFECARGSGPAGPKPRVAGAAVSGGSRAQPAPAPVSPGLADWMSPQAVDHDWRNSYMLALLSYFIYSDALGDPASSATAFRGLMQDWGMEDVAFTEIPSRHLRAAVVSGPGLVVVVFRGSEMQSTSHCVLRMVFPSLCPDLPANWVTNLSFAPLRQRPEWGGNLHLRTHPGFDSAVEALYADVLADVQDALGAGRRLFVTGHSLGGALATLFAYRAQMHADLDVRGVYTYGAPRLVNVPFAAHYAGVLGARTHRWQNRADPAPAVPPGQPIGDDPIPPLPALVARETYRHLGRLHYLPASGPADLDMTAEPVQLAGSFSQAMAGDHMMAKSTDSYVERLFARLPQPLRDELPPPP